MEFRGQESFRSKKELSPQDEEKIALLETLNEELILQIQMDKNERKNMSDEYVLSQDKFDEIVNELKQREKFLRGIKGYVEKGGKITDWSAFVDMEGLSQLRDEDEPAYRKFCEEVECEILKELEPITRKRVEVIMARMEEISDKICTTDQGGSDTMKEGHDNDSIYYLYKMSDGTYLSQRLKRNNIGKGLAGVINPVANIITFTGRDVHTGNLAEGKYDTSQISLEPKEGFYVTEYFLDQKPSMKTDFDKFDLQSLVAKSDNNVSVNESLNDDHPRIRYIHEGDKVNNVTE